MADNLSTVLDIYAKFGEGDVPGILEHLSDDVEWEKGQRDTTVPWLSRRKGPQEVVGFFQSVAEEMDIETFEPCGEPMIGERSIAIPCTFIATIKRNGARIEEPLQVHLWWFDDSGKVTGFRHVNDLTASENAFAA
jgi:ketosteroid isomerase-like protein